MTARYVGLDVGAAELAICMIDEDGNVVAHATLETSSTEIASFVTANAGDTMAVFIGLEAGSISSGLTRKLRSAGFTVHVFETRQASKFLKIRRNKTDANDARGIADLTRLGRGTVGEVFVKSIPCQHLRSKLVMRNKLVRQRVAGEVAIGAIFRLNQGRLKRSESAVALRRTVVAEVDRIRDIEGVDLSREVEPVLQLCETIRKHIKATDRDLKKLAAGIPACRAFMEIPGVGYLTALSVYSAIEDPARFAKLEDVGAYFGLTPSISESGTSRRVGGISRMGNTLTRTHLVTAATVMMNMKPVDCALYTWAKAIADRAGVKKARAALARKLVMVMVSMWKTGEPFAPSGRPPITANVQPPDKITLPSPLPSPFD